jgi:hypothetical protein
MRDYRFEALPESSFLVQVRGPIRWPGGWDTFSAPVANPVKLGGGVRTGREGMCTPVNPPSLKFPSMRYE